MIEFSLRDFDDQKDLELFYEVRRDQETMRFFGVNVLNSHSDALKLLNEYKERMEMGESFRKVICTNSKRYIGEIGIYKIDRNHKRANSYCILLPEFRKKGVSKLIAPQFYKMAYGLFDLNRIQALVDTRNINAYRSLKGIGYLYEGTLKQYEHENGEFIDLDIFAMLKEDFYLKYFIHH